MGMDSLYYIKDYSGNYYRADKSDQLVAAACESEATVFTFAQANSRIGAGKKAAFYCAVPIEECKTEEIGKEIVKTERGGTENTQMETDSEEEQSSNIVVWGKAAHVEKDRAEKGSEAAHRLAVKELIYEEQQAPAEKDVSSYDLSELDWAEYLTHFTYIASGLKDYREELAKKHSDIEQKICDVLHYIELCETDEQEAVDLVELLRVCRENRREIKDELMRIEYFQSNFGTSANVAKAKQALKSIKGLETRKYKPRKYNELFESCIMKDRHQKNADSYVSDVKRDKGRQHITERVFEEDGSRGSMAEERYFTPYDGKENDWLSFARQQAEFYRNCGQYIVNLQMDIRELDQEIEDILTETEAANCNVAQGYKVFKQLKELRLEKKAKTQELNCLYALTQYIDCDALADVVEENLNEIEGIVNVWEESEIENDADTEKTQEIAG